MLTRLSIRNIVLIDKADIEFGPGLCVLTGETGAGKSILLDAVSLILGGRAETRLIRAGQADASVSAVFTLAENSAAACWLSDQGLGGEPAELIIRRQLGVDGKSRAFINDEPVSVNALKQLGQCLIERHGQHDQRGLLDRSTHLQAIDMFGQLEAQRARTAKAFASWQAAQQEREALKQAIAEAEREEEYLTHVAEELRSLALEPGEAERLQERRSQMMQSEKSAQTLQDAMNRLCGEPSLAQQVHDIQRGLLRSSRLDPALCEPVVEALERSQQELNNAEEALLQLQDACAYSPAELERVEERLFAIKAAARKHRCEAEELIRLAETVEQKLHHLQHQQQDLASIDRECQTRRTAFLEQATRLSDARRKAAARLERAVKGELTPLKMQKCQFKVHYELLDESLWKESGMDCMIFEAATNAGQATAPLHQIASGGEMSRFMLALKVALAQVKSTPTLIFDEIDAGTGGAVADAIGARLSLLAEQAQVLVVTHSPQVAARGHHHLFIEKQSRKGQTFTAVSLLDEAGHREELARMLAGAEVTEEARKAASRLLEPSV